MMAGEAIAVASEADARRMRAMAAATAVVEALGGMGVTALVIGSLARGGFGPHSDIDFLITACPRRLKYAIEGVVEDLLGGLPFDVVYLDELPAWKVSRFAAGAVDARDLH
jgi:predicted nucleotidyltransferase